MTGMIPPELGNLALLDNLEIGGASLTGAIPAELGRLNRLTRLVIHGDGISGCIPVGLRDTLRTAAFLDFPFCDE